MAVIGRRRSIVGGIGFIAGLFAIFGIYLIVRAVLSGSVINPSFGPTDDTVDLGRWTPLPALRLGGLPTDDAAPVSYAIPGSSVPAGAQQVLVFAAYWSTGGAGSPATHWQIWTEKNGTRTAAWLAAFSNLNELDMSSVNAWLPVTPERQVRALVQVDTLGVDPASGIWIIGYR